MNIYPPTLPTPSFVSTSAGETFFKSDFEFASRQRATYCADYYVSFTFKLKTNELMQSFKEFYYNSLNNGSRSFEAEWDIEGISGVKEFRFAKRYQPKLLALGLYEVSATFELVTKIKDL